MKKREYSRHGLSRTPTYKCWSDMHYRCRTVGFKRWHDRGISVCKRWAKFENFLQDMGERPKGKSIDRIDNDKEYSKGNCRWATPKEQAINRGVVRLFTYKKLSLTLTDWSPRVGVKRSTLAQRFYTYKWSVKKMLSTPTT